MEPEKQNSLFEWVSTLPVFRRERITPTAEHFKDGVMMAKILKDIIDPEFFDDLNYSQDNSTPLIKIIEKMKRYLAVKVGHQIPSHLLPNNAKIITSGDVREIGRLLQLLLVCAVKCPEQATFINDFMQLENKTQFQIMACIKEMEIEEDLPDESMELSLKREYLNYREVIDELHQKNHELNNKLSQINEEKAALFSENEKLHLKLNSRVSEDPVFVHTKQEEDHKKEVEKFREENYKLEAIIDDYKLKQQVLEKQLNEVHSKLAFSATATEELLRAKDEIDSLREATAKVSQHEITIQQLKNRLEASAFLKNDVKQFEQKNEELIKANIRLEDELRKMSNWKSQIDGLKKQLADTQQRLSQETQRAIKAEFDARAFREKFENGQEANKRLQDEKSRLTEQLEEIRLTGTDREGNTMTRITSGASVESMDLLPPVFREKILRLELENKKLQDRIQAQIDAVSSDEASKILVEQLRKRETELDEALLTKEQENAELKTFYDEKMRELTTQLATKDEELKKKEIQYNKCMAKAKKVINTLEPTAAAATDPSKPDPEMEKARAIREVEEKLLASAFYNYGLTLHRNGVEARNATLLQRQRTAAKQGRKSDF